MNALTLVLGLVSLGLVKTDVSHLRQSPYQQQQATSGSTYIANNGQLVKQSFNSNGDASFHSSRTYNAGNDPNYKSRYWWMNTEKLPFTKSHHNEQNYFSAAGCNGCASRTLNIKHDTQQNAYSQNSFTNAKPTPYPSEALFHRIQTTSVSAGSPRRVNDFFSQQKFDSGLIQQSSSCADSNSACVAPKFCLNGFIDQSATYKARSSVSISHLLYVSHLAKIDKFP